jgi:hypothetical protein
MKKYVIFFANTRYVIKADSIFANFSAKLGGDIIEFYIGTHQIASFNFHIGWAEVCED